MTRKTKLILVADDSPVIRAVVEDILVEEGFEVAVARDGLEAVSRAHELEPDLMLLDMVMPRMSGVEVCRKLRERKRDSHLPIIMVTSLGDTKHLVEAMDAGADDYVTKPPDRDELVARTKSLLKVKELYDRILKDSHRLETLNRELERTNREIEARTARMTREMEIARKIQKLFIPTGDRDFGFLKLRVDYQPCEYIGGDYVDYHRTEDGVVHMILADVSGHGLPAAIIVSVVKSYFINAVRQGVPGERFMRELEGVILGTTLDSQYLTGWYLAYDPRDGRLTGLNAGHGPLLHLPAGASEAKWLTTLNPMIGIFPGNDYSDSMDLLVGPGDRFLVFTDGITDQSDGCGELFSERRVKQLFEQTGGLGLDQGITRIVEDAREFSKTRAFDDDLAFLGFEVVD